MDIGQNEMNNASYSYTVCYILVDDKRLIFYNQLLISLFSLRKWNSLLPVVVLMDTDTEFIIRGTNSSELSDWNISCISVSVPEKFSQKEKSRYLKTSLRSYLAGDILYVDTDTVIADALPKTVSDADLAMVQDGNWSVCADKADSINELYKSTWRDQLLLKCGYTFNKNRPYFNTGVLWFRDNENMHLFFRKWHQEWLNCKSKGVIYDQPSLNYLCSLTENRVGELDGSWNVQVSAPLSIRYLEVAKIIHYYNNQESVYQMAVPEIQKEGYKSAHVQKILNNPKEAFFRYKLVRVDEVAEDITSNSAFYVLKRLYLNHHMLYRGVVFVCSFLRKHMQREKKD